MKHGTIAVLCLLSAPGLWASLLTSGESHAFSSDGENFSYDDCYEANCIAYAGGASAGNSSAAAYGRLTAYVGASTEGITDYEDAWAYAAASFSDSLTFRGFSSPGFASFRWFIFVDLSGSGTSATVMGKEYLESPPNPFEVITIPITPGVAVDISARVGAGAYVRFGPDASVSGAEVGLLGIELTDTAGRPVLGSLVSDSGTRYPLVTASPEPSTFLLAPSILAAVAALRKIRRTAS